MKLALALSLSAALASCAASSAAPTRAARAPDAEYAQHFGFYLGGRQYDEGDWDPVDDHAMLGVDYSNEPDESPVGFEAGFMASAAEGDTAGSDVEAVTGELFGGLHKSFGSGRLRVPLGAGIAALRAAVDLPGQDDDSDVSLAFYAHGGVGVALGQNVSLGLDARGLFGSDVEISGFDADADYVQLALVLGVGF
jgi:hypothetical protein